MRQKSASNNGDLSLTLTFAKRHGISSSATLTKALRELVAVGLIAVTREGGSLKGGQRMPTLYRFTDIEVFPMPGKFIEATKPTNDWRAITTVDQANKKIADAEKAAALIETARKTKRLLQKLTPTSSKTEAVKPETTSVSEAWTSRPVQKLKQGNGNENAGKPMLARVSG